MDSRNLAGKVNDQISECAVTVTTSADIGADACRQFTLAVEHSDPWQLRLQTYTQIRERASSGVLWHTLF